MQGLALKAGNSNWVKKELNRVKKRQTTMQEEDYDFGVTNEDTEILNLPLYTKRKEAFRNCSCTNISQIVIIPNQRLILRKI